MTTNYRHTPEAKRKIGEASKARKAAAHAQPYAVKATTGVPKSTETRSKIAQSLLGTKLSPERKEAIRSGLLASDKKLGKPREWTEDEVKGMIDDQQSREDGTYGSKLSRKDAWDIKFKLIPKGVPLNKIGSRYGVHWKSISNIKHGSTWGFLEATDYDN